MLISRRNILTLAACSAVAGTTGCFASFGATTALWKWNDGVSSNKWVKWLIFLVLGIVPVYVLFILGDLWIFNTIEFFTGNNVFAGTTRDYGNGNTVAFQRDQNDPNLLQLEHRQNGKLMGTYYVKKDGEKFSFLDSQRHLITTVSEENGIVKLRDKHGHVLIELDQNEMDKLTARVLSTGAVTASLMETLGEERLAFASNGTNLQSSSLFSQTL